MKQNENWLVSIVVPCYNTAFESVWQCMNCLLSQTYERIEVILVDDGSKEELATKLDETWGREPKVRIFHNKNQGVSAARNFGTQKATGEYLFYVDADDLLPEYVVGEAVNVAKKTKADVIYGRMKKFVTYDVQLKDEGIKEQLEVLSGKEDLKRLCSHIFTKNDAVWEDSSMIGEFNGEGPWAKFVKTTLAKQVQFPLNMKIGEDTAWNVHLVQEHNIVACVTNRIWYYYYQNESGAISKFSPKKLEDIKVQVQYFNNYLGETSEYEQAYLRWLQIKIKNQMILGFFLHPNCSYTKKEKMHLFVKNIHEEPWNIVIRKKANNKKLRLWMWLCKNGLLLLFYEQKKKLKHRKV